VNLNTRNNTNLLTILYQDDYLVAIDKPPGLLVHRSMIAKHETEFAMQMLRDQIGARVYPVHRLDRPTSGVLVFALSRDIATSISMQFSSRQVAKSYRAVVRGHCDDTCLIEYPLAEIHDAYTDSKAQKNKPAQEAITHVNTLQRYEIPLAVGRYATGRFSLIELNPETGRKHQLRRHMAHYRHPILGDTTHGDGKQNKFLRHHFNFANLALTCICIKFEHPFSAKQLIIESSVHEGFEKLIKAWEPFQVPGSDKLNTHRVITS
jgi:tRNA pseudouridine65 synthase